MPNRERYVIEIADAGSKGDPPAAVRLRRLLKSALRGYGFSRDAMRA